MLEYYIMDNGTIFNITVSVIGIIMLSIHIVNILMKKNRRKDENHLLAFIIFTVIHFGVYLFYLIHRINRSNDLFIMSCYTTFYIMNNIEALILFVYTTVYLEGKKEIFKISKIINYSVLLIYIILDIVNIFTHMFFYSENGVYIRAKTMIISQGYQFICLGMIFLLAVLNKQLRKAEKIAFSLYCILPLIAIIFQNALPGYAIAYLSIIISIEILFLFVNIRKNELLAEEANKINHAEVKIMLSQIQPHCVYNTLASISTLIKINPDKAQEGLDHFTEYLRANLSSLTESGLIPFEEELRHVRLYLELEKMRFDERLTFKFDIASTDFFVPPLSLQPIVENAVKHGILKKIEGGTIQIRAYEDEVAHIVEVIDDGVGVDMSEFDKKDHDNKHVGYKNVKFRVKAMCKGDMEMTSTVGVGTTVIMKFYK